MDYKEYIGEEHLCKLPVYRNSISEIKEFEEKLETLGNTIIYKEKIQVVENSLYLVNFYFVKDEINLEERVSEKFKKRIFHETGYC
jgi:translation initiation factor 6 (eIF-6)